jgi:hypothetical protein
MRDPRRRQTQRGRGGQSGQDALRAGQTMAEEDEMAAAAEAMSRAITSLDALKTGQALPPEMEALNHLLKAQADVKRRQVARQQAGAGGPGNNNRNYDISTLFDKELQRTQQTNYETPNSTEQKEDPNASTLDKVRELARRQDELLRKQQALEAARLSEADLQRELEKLTREQNELRQKLEELAQQQASKDRRSANSAQSAGRSGGEQSSGKQGNSGTDVSSRMRDISEQMRSAAGDLRRRDQTRARSRGTEALDKLRELERQMQARAPDERRRALGDMQLETRQLADAQRQVASEVAKTGQGSGREDTMRRLAGEQDRIADRVKRLADALKQQGSGAGSATREGGDKSAQSALGDASRELERQRLAERMQKSAEQMRRAAQSGSGGRNGEGPKADEPNARAQADAQQEMARTLDKVADKLASAAGTKNADSRKLSEQLARAQELRDRLSDVSRDMQRLGEQAGRGNSQNSNPTAPGDTGRAGRGQSGGGSAGGSDAARLRQEYAERLKEAEDLMQQLRRDDPNFARGGAGFTFEGQGMTLSAPGTEAFKQDFARWEELRRQATAALDRAETALSKKLQAQQAKDRLAAGVEDKAPAEYQKQVDSYFKALASRRRK